MDSKNSLSLPVSTKDAINWPLMARPISGFPPVIFPFSISTGVMFLLNISSTPTYQCSSKYLLLLFMAWLTFFLGVVTSLLFTMKSTIPLGRISARFIHHVTLVASVTTLILAIPELFMALSDLNELSNGEFGWAIQSGLICFVVAGFYKLIREKFPSWHQECLIVAVLNLGIAFAGLYTGPRYYLPGTIPSLYSTMMYRTDWLYQFALIPGTFVLGTIILILGVVPGVILRVPFVSAISKENLTVPTLAVGLTTLLTGTFAMISVALVNMVMSSGFGVGVPAEQ